MADIVRLYTDGACFGNPGPGGWAVVWNTKKGVISKSGSDTNTTNNRMELCAVLEALKLIERKSDKKKTYEICSDSAYVVNAINDKWLHNWWIHNWKTSSGNVVKNVDLWRELQNILQLLISRNYKVIFRKVKGHSGNVMNEYADKIAKAEVANQQYIQSQLRRMKR